MQTKLRSLLGKEWIKLRRGIWIVPFILMYAAGDSFLTLSAIKRSHGAFGLWQTLVDKQPQFFYLYILLAASGVLIGFLQAWPETQGKRLRLLFHTPIEPERIISTLLTTGMVLVLTINLLAFVLLSGTLCYFHLPKEIIIPVLQTIAPWSLLSFAAYLGTVAFFCSNRLPTRVFVLATVYSAYSLLADPSAYGLFAHSLGYYALGSLLFMFLVYYTCLRFMGEPSHNRIYILSRAASLLLGCCSASAILLILFWRIATPAGAHLNMYYSPVLQQFVMSSADTTKTAGPSGTEHLRYTLENGSIIKHQEYTAALPFLYVKDLVKWDNFPESINGVPITPREAERGWQLIRLMSYDWNSPPPLLHMLIEASPHGARLQRPVDFFRVTADRSRIEFLRPEDGRIDKAKSSLFNNALQKAGFRFPVLSLGGNPDVRKQYDVGYFLIDAVGCLFQMQMVDAKPVCTNLKQTVPEPVKYITIKEHHRRQFYGFIVSEKAVYAIMQQDGNLKKLPVSNFNPDAIRLSIWSDLLHSSVVTQSLDPAQVQSGYNGTAMNPDFSVTRHYRQQPPPAYVKTLNDRRTIASALFPLQIKQTLPGSSYRGIYFQYGENRLLAAASGILSLVMFIVIQKIRRRSIYWWDCCLTALFGPIALLMILLAESNLSLFPFKHE